MNLARHSYFSMNRDLARNSFQHTGFQLGIPLFKVCKTIYLGIPLQTGGI